MIILDELDMDMPLNLLPCAGCGKLWVLKVGDYCRECAVKTEARRYSVVNPTNVEDVAKSSGVAKSYLMAKQEDAFLRNCKYVVYLLNGKWRELVINDQFSVRAVMNARYAMLEDEEL